MGLRDLVNKGKCLIGLHEGEWRAASPTVCTYTRRCVRCAAEHTKVEHPWGDWRFVAAASCDQQRACPRCDLHEQRVLHSYSHPAFVAADRCERQETCARCHDIRTLAPQHSMTAWRFVGDDDCRQVEQCSRCHTDGTRSRTEHAWTDWQHSNAHNGAVRVCKRCGDLQVQPAPATPTPVSYSEAVILENPDLDPRLVAHWRNTNAMASGGFSLVTDTHLVLDANGRWRRWTHSVSGMGDNTSEPVTGTWHAAGGMLHSRIDDGAEASIRYMLDGSTLFFPDAGSNKVWERVR